MQLIPNVTAWLFLIKPPDFTGLQAYEVQWHYVATTRWQRRARRAGAPFPSAKRYAPCAEAMITLPRSRTKR